MVGRPDQLRGIHIRLATGLRREAPEFAEKVLAAIVASGRLQAGTSSLGQWKRKLALCLPHYPRHYGRLLPCQEKLLEAVSPATLDRMLATRKAQKRHGLSATRPGTLLHRQVPIQGEVWDERRVGFLEADNVAHCGGGLAGNFLNSLTYPDLACTWTEGGVVWNKGSEGVLAQTRDVEAKLPFAILGFDFDNGGEWLNWSLIRYLQVRPKPIRVRRSLPYHSDDNAHVEQKNWMWPRQLLGYGRLARRPTVGRAPQHSLPDDRPTETRD